MATWKKVIVSGSSAELAGLTLDTALTVANGGTGLTGSGTDNFLVGNGSTSFTTVGSNGTGTVVRSTNPVGITGMSATGSFTGSFIGTFAGDGSALTGIVTTLDFAGDGPTTGDVDLKTQTFTLAGGTNINTSAAGETLTINLDNNISVTDATINGDLTVYGTASFANTENLLVADRFVLFGSGSTTTGDGGIVVQQGTQDIGELYGYDASATRWGLDTGFNASLSTFTPQAFVSAVVDIAAGQSDLARYQKNGNIKVDSGGIYIYS